MISKKIYLYDIIFSIILIFVNILLRNFSINHLSNRSTKLYINYIFDFVYIKNKGILFGLFDNIHYINLIISILGIIFLIILIFFYVKLIINKRNIYILRSIFNFLFSGILCNVFERIVYNGVLDFIKFKLFNFAVFNISDIYIIISVILFVFFIVNNEITNKGNKFEKRYN